MFLSHENSHQRPPTLAVKKIPSETVVWITPFLVLRLRKSTVVIFIEEEPESRCPGLIDTRARKGKSGVD